MPSRFRKIAVYESVRWLMGFVAKLFLRYRVIGKDDWPEGAALVCANHQSFMDPILVGLAYRGRLNYLARETLFKSFVMQWLITSLDGIPINREGLGIGGLKEALRRLKRGEKVLIFPEGTRTYDGELRPFQPGFLALARRANVPIVPIRIEGAYESWPRKQKLPGIARVRVAVRETVTDCRDKTDDELIAELVARIAPPIDA